MAAWSNEAKVGLFVLLAVLIFVLGILFLQEYRFEGSGYFLKVLFDNVSGLTQGDPVDVAGLKDVLEMQFPGNASKRWTYHYKSNQQIDYLTILPPVPRATCAFEAKFGVALAGWCVVGFCQKSSKKFFQFGDFCL